MTGDETIVLGGRAFALRPLTLRQLRTILPAFARAGEGGQEAVDASADILHAALLRAHPELSREDVLDLEMTVPEMNEAVAAIARISGLVPLGEAGAGSR